MGNTFMAYDPNITRGVLAVPGGVWSMLFERSNAWHAAAWARRRARTTIPRSTSSTSRSSAWRMEPYDPITTAAHVLHDPLPGVPAKTILMWYTIGDCLVTNITTEMVARTMGIDLLAPASRTSWRMTPKAGPLVNGINVYNDHPTPLPPDSNLPPANDNGTAIRNEPKATRYPLNRSHSRAITGERSWT